MLDDKRRTLELYAENFLQGNLDFRRSSNDAEKVALLKLANGLRDDLVEWVADDQTCDKEDKKHREHTIHLFFTILGHRARGDITGQIVDHDLNMELKKEKEKNSKLQKELKECKEDVLKAINELKDNDRTMAGLEAQIFYLKKE